MLARIRKSMQERDQGFTLIELLVVMIIIGILAAIAIPTFLTQREKARDTATKADVSTAGKELAAYFVDQDNVPALTLAQTNAGDPVVISDGATYTATIQVSDGTDLVSVAGDIVDADDWCIAFANDDGQVGTYSYVANVGLVEAGC